MNATTGKNGATGIEAKVGNRRWFRFAFYETGRADRSLPLHHLRDGDAALFLAPALARCGIEYSGLILNPPHSSDEGPSVPLVDVDKSIPSLTASDLVVLTTRPPLKDWEEGNRSQVDRSYNTFEQPLMAALKRYFQWCSRMRVQLTEQAAAQSPLATKYGNVEFGEGPAAPIKRFQSRRTGKWTKPDDRRLTVVYLVRTPELWENGPQLLTAFGMGGLQTLAWAYRLGRDYPHLLTDYDFVVAEVLQSDTPSRPITMDFADSWVIQASVP